LDELGGIVSRLHGAASDMNAVLAEQHARLDHIDEVVTTTTGRVKKANKNIDGILRDC